MKLLIPIFLVFLVAPVALPARAEVVAADPFDYPEGDLAGAGGGMGAWKGKWTGGATVKGEGLAHAAGGTKLAVVGRKAVAADGDPKASFRLLDVAAMPAALTENGKVGKAGSSLWIAMLVAKPMAHKRGDWAGLSLCDGEREEDEKLLIGLPIRFAAWGIDAQQGDGGVAGKTPVGTPSLLVMRIDFGKDKDKVLFWVNPVPGDAPADDKADASAERPHFTFDRIRIAAGIKASAGGLHMDEIRIATTFADAVPAAK